MHVMMQQIMALFDEHQSKENAKHVLRALKENGQGLWNGSLPPIGCRVAEVDLRHAPKARRIPEACRILGISRSTIYRLAAEGRIRLIRIGSRTLVPETELDRLASEGA